LQLKVLQSILNDISISFLSAKLAAPFVAAIFLLPTACRKSSELLILTLELDDAPERFVKFLLLAPRCCVDETESESLAIERVDAPMFAADVSKLLPEGLPELPAAVVKFGEPDRAN
jgi:hypothetical protein